MRPLAILGTLRAIKGYTCGRSGHMNIESSTLKRVGEGLLALVATVASLLILKFALAAECEHISRKSLRGARSNADHLILNVIELSTGRTDICLR
jgi:hypothetical protein